jgi:hypothetical protein
MNKQEAIDKINNITARETFMSEIIWVKRDEVIDIVKQLDEPEKPVVPQFVDTWIQGAKYNGFDLYEAMTDETPDKTTTWIVCNPETFAKAWIYGYEVEKEKLYTARLKLISVKKYSYINKEKEKNRLFIYGLDTLNDMYQIHFTQAELEEINIWNNPAFEIKEVTE